MALLLTESDVRALITMPDLIETMERALIAFSAGQIEQPVRTVVPVDPAHGVLGLMPAYVPGLPALGAKLVTVFHDNDARGLPSHLASVLLFNPETGALETIMDGRYITEARTGAVSAVSVRAMARPDISTMAVIGSGVQARSHVAALRHVRDFRDIRVWSPAPDLGKFAAETATRAVSCAEEAVRGAEVVVLVTASPTPVIQDAWVAPGAHVVCVGACRPNQREMDPALVARGRLVVDSRAAALKESGDVVLGIREGYFPEDHIVGELGEVAAGKVPGRTSNDEVTIFKALGLAVEDVSTAHLVLTRARQQHRGVEVSL